MWQRNMTRGTHSIAGRPRQAFGNGAGPIAAEEQVRVPTRASLSKNKKNNWCCDE